MDGLLVFFDARLKSSEHLLVLLGGTAQDIFLLLLHLLYLNQDLCGYIMNFLFLLQTVYYLGNLIGDSLDTFGLIKQSIDRLLIVPHLHLSLSQLILARVINAREMKIINLLLEHVSPLLKVHYLLLVQQLQFSMDVLHLFRHCVILFGSGFPVPDNVMNEL